MLSQRNVEEFESLKAQLKCLLKPNEIYPVVDSALYFGENNTWHVKILMSGYSLPDPSLEGLLKEFAFAVSGVQATEEQIDETGLVILGRLIDCLDRAVEQLKHTRVYKTVKWYQPDEMILESDKSKWTGVIMRKGYPNPQAEITNGTVAVVVSLNGGYKYKGYGPGQQAGYDTSGKCVHIGSIGPIQWNWRDYESFLKVVEEARQVLHDFASK